MAVSLPNLSFTFKTWLPFAILATILSLLVYIAVQQDMRLTANDVPLQMAEDASRAVSQGQFAAPLSTQKVDISTSLAPFVVLYDDKGKPKTGTGLLHEQLPELPRGVFDYARKHQDDRITWQPESGVRVASVIKHFDGANPGFVMAGKSLREVEQHEKMLIFLVFGGWLTALIGTFFSLYVLANLNRLKEVYASRKA